MPLPTNYTGGGADLIKQIADELAAKYAGTNNAYMTDPTQGRERIEAEAIQMAVNQGWGTYGDTVTRMGNIGEGAPPANRGWEFNAALQDHVPVGGEWQNALLEGYNPDTGEVPRFKYREFVPNTVQTTATDILNGSSALDQAMIDALGLDSGSPVGDPTLLTTATNAPPEITNATLGPYGVFGGPLHTTATNAPPEITNATLGPYGVFGGPVDATATDFTGFESLGVAPPPTLAGAVQTAEDAQSVFGIPGSAVSDEQALTEWLWNTGFANFVKNAPTTNEQNLEARLAAIETARAAGVTTEEMSHFFTDFQPGVVTPQSIAQDAGYEGPYSTLSGQPFAPDLQWPTRPDFQGLDFYMQPPPNKTYDAGNMGDFAGDWDDALYGSPQEAMQFLANLEGDAYQSSFISAYMDENNINLESPIGGWPDEFSEEAMAGQQGLVPVGTGINGNIQYGPPSMYAQDPALAQQFDPTGDALASAQAAIDAYKPIIPAEAQEPFWEWYNQAENRPDDWAKAYPEWQKLDKFLKSLPHPDEKSPRWTTDPGESVMGKIIQGLETEQDVQTYLDELKGMTEEERIDLHRFGGEHPGAFKSAEEEAAARRGEGKWVAGQYIPDVTPVSMGDLKGLTGFLSDVTGDPLAELTEETTTKTVDPVQAMLEFAGGLFASQGTDLSGLINLEAPASTTTTDDGAATTVTADDGASLTVTGDGTATVITEGGDVTQQVSNGDGTFTEIVVSNAEIVAAVEEIFGNMVTVDQIPKIRERMAELGTTDLTTVIETQMATISTPDYGPAITQRFGEMGTAVEGSAAERRRILEESTTRAEGRIGEIKTGLTTELETLETDRVEQQQAVEQKVIDRTTEFEQTLVDRLSDIRLDLGDQVTSEFEEVAALVETLTESQALSSRDAMSRLTAIGDMAAAARSSAPAELSAEALTALGDLEFQVENQIAQGLADQKAQIEVDMAGALLSETMRKGDFETAQQQTLVQALLQEQLRGVTYEDRTKELLVQSLMGEDQYVRQFNENVDQAMAQAQLTNLWGTQDYQRQLDMLGLQRDWGVADTTQARQWQTDDMAQGREWQTDDMAQGREWQTEDTAQGRGWQIADMLLGRGWQVSDTAQARGWDVADAATQREQDLFDALAEAMANAPGNTILDKVTTLYPKAPDSLKSTASQISQMDWTPVTNEYAVEDGHGDLEKLEKGDIEGTAIEYIMPGHWTPTNEWVPEQKMWHISEKVQESPAEIYLGRLIGKPEFFEPGEWDAYNNRPYNIPILNAEDGAMLVALVDLWRQFDEQGAAALAVETGAYSARDTSAQLTLP